MVPKTYIDEKPSPLAVMLHAQEEMHIMASLYFVM
jgi:hypothetical protein